MIQSNECKDMNHVSKPISIYDNICIKHVIYFDSPWLVGVKYMVFGRFGGCHTKNHGVKAISTKYD